MSGKGDKRRPGEGYQSGWDRIFGCEQKNVVECCKNCGLPVRYLPPGGVSVCDDCGVVEGNTMLEEINDA